MEHGVHYGLAGLNVVIGEVLLCDSELEELDEEARRILRRTLLTILSSSKRAALKYSDRSE